MEILLIAKYSLLRAFAEAIGSSDTYHNTDFPVEKTSSQFCSSYISGLSNFVVERMRTTIFELF